MRAALLAVTLLALAACGGDSTGPNASADVSGQWTYNATNLSGSGVSCNISNVTFSLTQSGSTFTGAATGGTITCTAAGESDTADLGTAPIANGQVNGNSVQFDIGTSDLHNAGTRNGNSITGTLTARVDVETTTVVLTGNFSLVKK
jgi:hypothetical protein